MEELKKTIPEMIKKQRPRANAPNYKPDPVICEDTAGHLENCMHTMVYVWCDPDAFWFYPIRVGQEYACGYKWGDQDWSYTCFPIDDITGVC